MLVDGRQRPCVIEGLGLVGLGQFLASSPGCWPVVWRERMGSGDRCCAPCALFAGGARRHCPPTVVPAACDGLRLACVLVFASAGEHAAAGLAWLGLARIWSTSRNVWLLMSVWRGRAEFGFALPWLLKLTRGGQVFADCVLTPDGSSVPRPPQYEGSLGAWAIGRKSSMVFTTTNANALQPHLGCSAFFSGAGIDRLLGRKMAPGLDRLVREHGALVSWTGLLLAPAIGVVAYLVRCFAIRAAQAGVAQRVIATPVTCLCTLGGARQGVGAAIGRCQCDVVAI